MDTFELRDLGFGPEDTPETTTHDSKFSYTNKRLVSLQRNNIKVSWRTFDPQKHDGEFMRLLFKPATQTLWGFHMPVLAPTRLLGGRDEEEEDENDVDMKKTMWLVLRKTKPTNETLKHFFAETMSYPIRIKEIIKFGRVNFKVSALRSSKLDPEIQGSYGQPSQLDSSTNQNVTQINDRGLYTEMNLNENITMSQILNVTATETKPKKKGGEPSDKSSERSGQRVCRICLGEEEES